jgi:hypothetical protein
VRGATPWLVEAVPDVLTVLGPAVVAGVLVWFGTFLQHRLTVKREGRRWDVEARASRVQFERDTIAELIAEMHRWANSVANLRVAYELGRQELPIDRDRFRKYQDELHLFAIALARARVSVQNPAARPPLESLRGQHIVMAALLNREASGSPSPESVARFEYFQRVLAEANQQLEEAALRWNGEVQPWPSESVQRPQ